LTGTSAGTRAAALALGAAVALAAGGAARAAAAGSDDDAGACGDRATAIGTGPLPSGPGPADFGAVPEPCADHEALLRLRGTLLVASAAPDFYGLAAETTTLRLRHPIGGRTSRTWVSVAVDAVTWRFVANATVQSSALGVGPPTVALHHALLDGARVRVAAYARLLLPFDSARQRGLEAGGEAGAAARLRAGPRSGLQGGVALAAPVDVVSGQAHAALRPAALAEAYLAPRRWAAFFAGGALRLQAAGDPALPVLTSLAARAAARFAVGRGVALAAAVEVPFAGSDRTDLLASIFAAWSPPPGGQRAAANAER
jgi:hypothetical protein